jgi:hypothetical protein
VKNYESREEIFNEIVENSFKESYEGIIKKKYYLKERGFDVVILEENGTEIQLDYLHEKPNFYDFLKIGDTLIKQNDSNSIIIKRSELDTTIYFKFDNVKGSDLYSKNNDFLNK